MGIEGYRPQGHYLDEVSDFMTSWVDQQDPEREREGREVAMFLQGLLAGAVHAGPVGQAIKIADIELGQDSHGNYEPFFTVVTEAGHRIRVSVELEA